MVVSHHFAYSVQPDLPGRIEPIVVERELRTRLAHEQLGSLSFHRALQAGLTHCGASICWQKTLGSTPIRIASVCSPKAYPTSSFAFWPTTSGSGVQLLDNINLLGKDENAFRIDGETYRCGDRMVRCGYGSDNGNWEWPVVRVYRLVGGQWVISASKVLRKIAAFPAPHFTRRFGKTDPTSVGVSMDIYPDHLSQPHAGPLLRYQQTWTVHGNQIGMLRPVLVPSAISELDRLAELAQSGRHARFNQSVPRAARARLWKLLQQKISVSADEPSTLDLWNDQVHEMGSIGISMHFVKRHGKFRLTRLEG